MLHRPHAGTLRPDALLMALPEASDLAGTAGADAAGQPLAGCGLGLPPRWGVSVLEPVRCYFYFWTFSLVCIAKAERKYYY